MQCIPGGGAVRDSAVGPVECDGVSEAPLQGSTGGGGFRAGTISSNLQLCCRAIRHWETSPALRMH